MLTWNDFEKVEMRVGTIIEVNDFPKARKPAFQLKIDFGEFGIKKSSAQITDLYHKESLVGQQIIAVLNFLPKQFAHFISECLVLGLVGEAKGVVLINPSQSVQNGLRVG